MLRREMMALGVLDEEPEDGQVPLAYPEMSWLEAPDFNALDWNVVWNVSSDCGGNIMGSSG